MLAGGASFAATQIKKIHISYSQLLLPVDRQGFQIPQAIIGGNIEFEGTAPVYVSLLIGGQTYTAPTDQLGAFSFLAFTANAGNYELRAWTPDVAEEGTTGLRALVRKEVIGVTDR